MKKITAMIFSFMMILCAAMLLSGCAAAFDMLNFNREPLSTIESEVEEGLTNKYVEETNVYTKEQFSKMLGDAFWDRDSYKDTFTIDCKDDRENYIYGYSEVLDAIDKDSVQDDPVTEKDNPKYLGEPYAQYYITKSVNGSRYDTWSYFYKEYFLDSGTKFLVDEYIDDFSFPLYETLQKGGHIFTMQDIIIDNFIGVDLKYNNGKKVYEVRVNQNAIASFSACVPDYFLLPTSFGEIKKLEPIEVLSEGEKIYGFYATLVYDGGRITFKVTTGEVDNFEYIFGAARVLPSYFYVYINALDNIRELTDYSTILSSLNLKASFDFTNYDSAYKSVTTDQFTYYNLRNEPYYDIFRSNSRIYAIELTDQTIFSNQNEIFILKNGEASQLNYGYDNYYQYLYCFNDPLTLLGRMDNSYWVAEGDDYNHNLIGTANGYKLEMEIVRQEYDYEQSRYIDVKEVYIAELDKGLSKINNFSYEIRYDGELVSGYSIQFEYNFDFVVPPLVANFELPYHGKY